MSENDDTLLEPVGLVILMILVFSGVFFLGFGLGKSRTTPDASQQTQRCELTGIEHDCLRYSAGPIATASDRVAPESSMTCRNRKGPMSEIDRVDGGCGWKLEK